VAEDGAGGAASPGAGSPGAAAADPPVASGTTKTMPGKGPDPLIGRVVNDRFRVVSMIARGGMGKVYRAEQAPLGREVALKVLNPNYSGDTDPEFHKRFFLEASTCSKLTHPNTVTIFDYGRTDDDIYYIAMELLEGRTLHRALRDEGPMEPARAMHVARQICRSLREAHALGVIHRDLKPANVYLMKHGDESDFVKVLDFGLVKDLDATGEDLTQTGLFMGSPKYMSPEQIRGEKVDARADVYALGVILYEMLTGGVPFDRPNSVNILMAHVHEAPPPMSDADRVVPPALEQIVLKALAKAPEDRFPSMDAMLAALKDLASDVGLSITHSTELGVSGEIGPLGSTGRYDAAMSGEMAAPTIQGSVPPAMAPMVEMAEAPNRTPWVFAGLGVLALIGAGFVAWLTKPPDPEAPTPTTSTAVSPSGTDAPRTSPRTVETPATPDVSTTLVVLRSEPPGATVAVADREYGPTPADVEWTGEQAERGRRVTFVFSLDGHRDYSVTRVITGERLEVEAELEPMRTRVVRPNRRRVRRSGDRGGDRSGGDAPVEGYKLDPY